MLRRKRFGKPIGQSDWLHFHQTVMRLLEIQFFYALQKEPNQPIGHNYYFANGHCSDGVGHCV